MAESKADATSKKTNTTADTKADEPKADSPAEPKPVSTPAKDRQPASESSDPAVHKLLADHQTATLNGDTAKADEVEKQLNDIGYTL